MPKNVTAYNDQEEALKGCEYVVLAVPFTCYKNGI